MKIQEIYNEQIQSLKPIIHEFPWESKINYGCWLAQTYFFVKESTRLLNLCGALMPQSLEDLHNRFIDHAKEEQGHAALLLKDLEALNLDIKNYNEFHQTALFYQSQYYWIQFHDPIAFFGYILLLEGVAAEFGDSMFEKVKNEHGRMSGIFLQVHSHEDEDHIQSAFNEIENFDEKQIHLISKNLKESSFLYQDILRNSATIESVANKAA